MNLEEGLINNMSTVESDEVPFVCMHPLRLDCVLLLRLDKTLSIHNPLIWPNLKKNRVEFHFARTILCALNRLPIIFPKQTKR